MKNVFTNTQVVLGTITAVVATVATALGVLTQLGVIHPAGLGSAKPTLQASASSEARRAAARPRATPSTSAAPTAAPAGTSPATAGQTSAAPSVAAVVPTVVATSAGSGLGPQPSPSAITSNATPQRPSATPSAPAALSGAVAVLGADSLGPALTSLNQTLEQESPGLDVQAQFGDSATMLKQVTDASKRTDVVAVADANLMRGQTTTANGGQRGAGWYVGFATNAMVIAYTDKSKDAGKISAENWYQVLSERGMQVGRVDPDAAPLGYQTLLALKLAEQHYQQAGLAEQVLANAPASNTQNTEAELMARLQTGQLDYAILYRSDAVQRQLRFLELPSEINLSDAGRAASYKTVSVQTKNGTQTGAPLIAAVTVPANAADSTAGTAYVQALLGPAGQQALSQHGFTVVRPAIAAGGDAVPVALRDLTAPWPVS